MQKRSNLGLATLAAVVLSTGAITAQTLPSNGLYQIFSGTYRECCGITGSPIDTPLPTQAQSLVRLTIDQNNMATMSFLANDGKTVFSSVPCPSLGAISFSFGFGFAFQNSIAFHVDPGPPPLSEYWSYIASNSASGLVINGTLGTLQSTCADVPTQFTHSNVVAVFIPPPSLSLVGFSTNGNAQLMILGTSGKTNVLQASIDLSNWLPISTNVMDYSDCPICPYVIVEDTQSSSLSNRWYRVFELH